MDYLSCTRIGAGCLRDFLLSCFTANAAGVTGVTRAISARPSAAKVDVRNVDVGDLHHEATNVHGGAALGDVMASSGPASIPNLGDPYVPYMATVASLPGADKQVSLDGEILKIIAIIKAVAVIGVC